jgi:hypothetical protein
VKIYFTTRAWLLSFRKLAISIGVLVCAAYQGAWAAQQGSTGLTSSGNIDITLVSGLDVRLTGLADMPLGTWSGSGDLTAEDDLCVGRSGVGLFATGNYRILANGNGEPGNPAAFTLYNGARSIHYDAYFNDATSTVGRAQLAPGVALTGQTDFGFGLVFNLLFGCFVENANISIVVPAAELSAASGVYAGTLTLVLIPE